MMGRFMRGRVPWKTRPAQGRELPGVAPAGNSSAEARCRFLSTHHRIAEPPALWPSGGGRPRLSQRERNFRAESRRRSVVFGSSGSQAFGERRRLESISFAARFRTEPSAIVPGFPPRSSRFFAVSHFGQNLMRREPVNQRGASRVETSSGPSFADLVSSRRDGTDRAALASKGIAAWFLPRRRPGRCFKRRAAAVICNPAKTMSAWGENRPSHPACYNAGCGPCVARPWFRKAARMRK